MLGHRVGAADVRHVWDRDKSSDLVSEVRWTEPPSAWHGLLGAVREGGAEEVSVEEYEAALRAFWGHRFHGTPHDTARCTYGASRVERCGGARVYYVLEGGGETRGALERAVRVGGEDRGEAAEVVGKGKLNGVRKGRREGKGRKG